MKLLLTGFEPFDGRDVNASQRVVLALREDRLHEVDLHTTILPVDRERGPATLLQIVQSVRPDTVLCLGEAKGRMRLSIERVAVNLLDYTIPDNRGQQVADEPIEPDGPAAYFVTLPVRAMHQRLVADGIPAELSLSAGTFLCNQVAYVLLHAVTTSRLPCRVGFIHLPLLSEQAAREPGAVPSMSLKTMQQGITTIIELLARNQI